MLVRFFLLILNFFLTCTLKKCGPFLKSLIEFVAILLLVFWPQHIWDLSFLIKD